MSIITNMHTNNSTPFVTGCPGERHTPEATLARGPAKFTKRGRRAVGTRALSERWWDLPAPASENQEGLRHAGFVAFAGWRSHDVINSATHHTQFQLAEFGWPAKLI